MNKYRIRIEQLDYKNNLIHQHQSEISEEMLHNLRPKFYNIDALDEAWDQVKHEFFSYLDKLKQG